MLTPLDIENRVFKKTGRGYNRDDVEDFMGLILNDYEKLYAENARLRTMIEKGTNNVSSNEKYDVEQTKTNAQNIIKNAEKQATEIVEKARNNANSIIESANIEIERLNECYISLRKKISEKRDVIKKYLESSVDMIIDDMVTLKNDEENVNTEETREK